MQFELKEKLWISIISAVTILIAFWLFNPFPLYFLNDDLIHIPLSKEGMLLQRNSLRPFGDWSVQMDYFFWEKNAAGYHFTNLLLHVINTLLVYLLSKTLLQKYVGTNSTHWQSIMVATLFFAYAFHSEAIFWILGRSGSLGTLFFIPALIFHLKRFDRKIFFVLSILFFVLGLFAYESVWVFPLIALLLAFIDYKILKSNLQKDIVFVTIIFVVFTLYLVIRFLLINEVAGSYEASAFYSFNLFELAGNFARLLVRCFLPPAENNVLVIVAGLVLILMILAFISAFKSRSSKKFLFLVTALLSLSFLPYLSLGISTHTVEGERYLYMPSIFAAMLLIQVIVCASNNKIVRLGLWTIILASHLYFLSKSKTYYATASAISEATFQQINSLKGKQRLFVDSLPKTVNGALVFRLGFDEGVQWLKKNGTVDTVFVMSVKQDNNWNLPYEGIMREKYAAISFNKKLIKDTTQRQTYVQQEMGPMQFNPQTDAWFIFNSNGLEVIK